METSDLVLAAALVSSGYRIENMYILEGRGVFVFELHPELDVDYRSFQKRKMLVEPNHFYGITRSLKTRIFNALKKEPEVVEVVKKVAPPAPPKRTQRELVFMWLENRKGSYFTPKEIRKGLQNGGWNIKENSISGVVSLALKKKELGWVAGSKPGQSKYGIALSA